MQGGIVAPLVGAWIEIRSLGQKELYVDVAPLVGAWIEIKHVCRKSKGQNSRSSRGSVD